MLRSLIEDFEIVVECHSYMCGLYDTDCINHSYYCDLNETLVNVMERHDIVGTELDEYDDDEFEANQVFLKNYETIYEHLKDELLER